MANYYVTKDPEGGWNVLRERAQRSSIHTDTQSDAEKEAKTFAANSGGGEVRVQGLNGRFRDSDTIPPANDPYPPKDTKH